MPLVNATGLQLAVTPWGTVGQTMPVNGGRQMDV